MRRDHVHHHQPKLHAGIQGRGQRGVRHGDPNALGRGRGSPEAGHRNGQHRRGDQRPGHDHQRRDQYQSQPGEVDQGIRHAAQDAQHGRYDKHERWHGQETDVHYVQVQQVAKLKLSAQQIIIYLNIVIASTLCNNNIMSFARIRNIV